MKVLGAVAVFAITSMLAAAPPSFVRTSGTHFTDASGTTLLQDHYARVWQAVVARFAGEPAVIGYDLMNEPAPLTMSSNGTARLFARGLPAASCNPKPPSLRNNRLSVRTGLPLFFPWAGKPPCGARSQNTKR